jgi:hypothetical protein
VCVCVWIGVYVWGAAGVGVSDISDVEIGRNKTQ